MANIIKRSISLNIKYRKEDPDNLTWQAKCECVTLDDSKIGGEDKFAVATPLQTITRTQFRALTGQQIENSVVTAIDDAIQQLGSGAGSHTITNDTGN